MEWFGFWIFASVCVCVDAWLYSKGHTAFFFKAKTDAEKAIQHREAYGVHLLPPSPKGGADDASRPHETLESRNGDG
jgi:hypothetical protein